MSSRYKVRYAISIIFAVVTLLIVCIQLIGVTSSMQIPVNFTGIVFYIAVIALIIIFYYLIKNKINKYNLKTKQKRYIKYAYIALVIIITRVIALFIFGNFNINGEMNEAFNGEVVQINMYKQIIYSIYNLFNIFIPCQVISNLVVNILITLATSLLIRKIIAKTTKNSTISDITALLYIMYPKNILMSSIVNYESINLLILLLVINLLFNIIKICKMMDYTKYTHIIYSSLIGLLISLDLLLGGNILIWLTFLVLVLFVVRNVEVVNIKIPYKLINKLDEKKKEFIYKIERININKLFVCMLVMLLVIVISSPIYFAIYSGTKNTNMFGYKSYAANFKLGSSEISLNINKNNIEVKDRVESIKLVNDEIAKFNDNKDYKNISNIEVKEAMNEYKNRNIGANFTFIYQKLTNLLKNDIDIDTGYVYNLNNYNIVTSIASVSNVFNRIIYIVLFISELLNLFSGRKKDVFTTIIKIAFISTFIFTIIFASAFYIVTVLQTLTLILAVLNIGNIYFNREDKIKMIASEN